MTLFVPPAMAEEGDATWPRNDEWFGYRELRRSISALRPDVLFIPTARVLRVDAVPVVTMVRNMEPLEVPFGGNRPVEVVKNLGRAWAAKQSSRRSDRLIAVSRHVRDFLVQRWRIPDEKIGVVFHGIDPAAATDPPVPAALAMVAHTRFLFTAGSIRPARGLEDIVSALGSLPEDVRLVIAGSVDRGAEHYERSIRGLAQERGVDARVIWAGQLNREAMSWCFRQAAFFVMTSRAEACPNVVLEAMAEGAASISTDHPPMPEFFADAAMYYGARDARQLGERLGDALAAPPEWQQGLRERARKRAAAFTWEATARATVIELQRSIE